MCLTISDTLSTPVQLIPTASGTGTATIVVTPELRWPFLDGATIHLAEPMVEGFVDGEAWGWQIPVNRLIAISYPLEEAA